jgi:hypothetical protein
VALLHFVGAAGAPDAPISDEKVQADTHKKIFVESTRYSSTKTDGRGGGWQKQSVLLDPK